MAQPGGHLTINTFIYEGDLNRAFVLWVGNLIIIFRKVQMPGSMPGGGGDNDKQHLFAHISKVLYIIQT